MTKLYSSEKLLRVGEKGFPDRRWLRRVKSGSLQLWQRSALVLVQAFCVIFKVDIDMVARLCQECYREVAEI